MHTIIVCDAAEAALFTYDETNCEQELVARCTLDETLRRPWLKRMRPSARRAMWLHIANALDVHLAADSAFIIAATPHYSLDDVGELSTVLTTSGGACRTVAQHCIVDGGGQHGLNAVIRRL